MGTVMFRAVAAKNPKTGLLKYRGQKMLESNISGKELYALIEQNSGLPTNKVVTAANAIVKAIRQFMMNGHDVSVKGLGTFGLRMTSETASTAAGWDTSMIKSFNLKFRPDTDIRINAQLNTSFQRKDNAD